MANFLPAFERMLINEGGVKLTDILGDKGGLTYCGIAKNRNPNWVGWEVIDSGGMPEISMVRAFYKTNYWDVLSLDQVTDQNVAKTLFDFGVNAGTTTAVKLAQIVIGVTPDGVLGPKTLAALNQVDPELFLARFSLAKLARYEQIVTRDRSQEKFLLGWVRRTIKEAA